MLEPSRIMDARNAASIDSMKSDGVVLLWPRTGLLPGYSCGGVAVPFLRHTHDLSDGFFPGPRIEVPFGMSWAFPLGW